MKRVVGLPKSAEIARTLEREIRSGLLPYGDRLESESTLVRRFSASRNTVRKGLEALARQGLIQTRSGVGSFVTYDGAALDNALGWTQALSTADSRLAVSTIRLDRITDTALAARIGAVSAEFLAVDRTRTLVGDGRIVSLERSRAPWRPGFAETLERGLANGSLTETLRGAGMIADHGEEWANVLTELSAEDAALLGRDRRSPMLHLRRLSRDQDGAPVEHVESLLDPDRFGLHLEF